MKPNLQKYTCIYTFLKILIYKKDMYILYFWEKKLTQYTLIKFNIYLC